LTTLIDNLAHPSNRVLEPMDRISEVLFALIMVLTFTCSFSVASAGREEVRTMLIGALGCNLAWGLIDAVFYLMGSFYELGQGIVKLRALRQATNSVEAHQIIAHALPPVVTSILASSDLEAMRQKLNLLPDLPPRPSLGKEAWLGALAVFLVVVLATLPVVVPFAVIEDARRALRVSNAIAVGMLFLAGYAFGRSAGHRPLAMGVVMVILGGAMVGITILLGG
jgi:VIT1/CCC1 family predicted Fe2+/Mn2+ transporter